MIKYLALAAASALAVASPAFAQTMTAADVGVQPVGAISATDYVNMQADVDKYEIASGRLAATRATREDVKGFGKQIVADHTTASQSLAAALSNADRKITAPSTQMSSAAKAKISLLRKAPKAGFDALYLQQQADAHKQAWALNRGYADNGTDPALKQVAAANVPVIERHISALNGLVGQN